MNRAQILEAVEALRQRKCRPEREAIAHYILRKYGTQFQEVFNDLETIVDQGDLVKVEYKGSISYRSPDAFDTKASPLLTKHSKILNSNRTTRFILTAITELLGENESYSKAGIPREGICTKLIEYDPTRFTVANVPIFLQRETTVGTLLPTSEGRLLPKDLHPSPNGSCAITTSNLSESAGSIPKMRGRKPASLTNKSAETTPTTSGLNLPETQSTSEVFAVKSVPVPVTSPPASKPVRSYGRKSATASPEKGQKAEDVSKKSTLEKNMPILSNSAEDSAIEPGEKMPSLVSLPEESVSGRSVRNKRKKEVFDPSDLPKKRPSVSATVSNKSEKEKPVSATKSKVTPTPPPAKPAKRPYRKRNKEITQTEKDAELTTLCEHCQRHKNIRGQSEPFVVCSDCSLSYHPSCLDHEKKHRVSYLVESGTWQCPECTKCPICQEKSVKGSETMFCSACDIGFHVKCLKLATRSGENTWLCVNCKVVSGSAESNAQHAEIKKEDAEEIEVPVPVFKVEQEEKVKTAEDDEPKKVQADPPTPETQVDNTNIKVEVSQTITEQPIKKNPVKLGRPPKKRIITLSLEKKGEEENGAKLKQDGPQPIPASSAGPKAEEEGKLSGDTDIPTDASKWTPSQVEAYFKKHGLRDEGILFREQEIDGLSLLLMRRQDIVNGMKLLLGPALKVFKLVVALQQSGGKVESATIL